MDMVSTVEILEYLAYNETEIMDLYASVGWTAYTNDPDALKRGFAHSLLTLGAYENHRLIGIVRAVGDGATVVLIQDLLVYPEHQRKGIGTALLQAVISRFPTVRQIQLVTDNTEKTKAFYRSCGFREYGEIGCCGFMKG